MRLARVTWMGGRAKEGREQQYCYPYGTPWDVEADVRSDGAVGSHRQFP